MLVFNNFNFGMTGGQHSTTTPTGAITSTTPGGNLERPLDICATVARQRRGLRLARHQLRRGPVRPHRRGGRDAECFALLDIWELCTAYYVTTNPMNRKALSELLDGLGFGTGVLYRREVAEYSNAYRAAHAADRAAPRREIRGVEPVFPSGLDRRFHLVVAGSAGGKVRSAARLLIQAAVLSGLYAAQRDDYPITVKTGHSVSELILSPEPIEYTGAEQTDALLVLTEDGRKKAGPYAASLSPGGRIFKVDGVGEIPGRIETLDLLRSGVRFARTDVALAALAAVVERLGLFPLAALEEAARRTGKAYVESNLAAISAGAAVSV